MMKKILYTVASVLVLGSAALGQDNNNFDKKFRFGLRIAGQPSWFSSPDNNNKPFGSKFGFGFGLNMERRFSDIVALQFGVGGDFEGGNYSFRYEQGKYAVMYWQNSSSAFVEPKNESDIKDLNNQSNTGYLLKERTIKTTHVTLPIILKLSTNEYSGFKYFGQFGAEVGIRIKTTATDKYYETYKYDATGGILSVSKDESQSNINLSKDGSTVPVRLGMNVGLGTEYRLGGSTSAFLSVNYFRSFTNLLKNDSKFLVYNADATDPAKVKYNFVAQNIIMSAIRINVGILF